MRVSRAPAQKAQAVEKGARHRKEEGKSFHIKEKGSITEETRSLVRDLVAIGVPAMHIEPTVRRVATALSVHLEGDISDRSVGRICLEGGVAAQIQIADEISNASSVTISGDGTSHKNTNYESRHINVISENGERHTRFLGIMPAINHTSEEQLEGWGNLIKEFFNLFNEYHKIVDPTTIKDFRVFFELLKGMNTDHAEDQKKLARLLKAMKEAYERERRGEKIVESMRIEEMLPILLQASKNAVTAAGGSDAWNGLSEQEQDALNLKAYRDLCAEVGQKDYDALADADKRSVDFFVWAGCCMHKELNSVKGGNVAMMAWWGQNNVTGPVKLMNRDNAAASQLGNLVVKSRAADVSQAGGVKLTSLAGAIFKHKDDKKGQQDTLRIFFEDSVGYSIPFPSTSNIRYQSHCEASAELLVHHDLYIKFLELVKDKKETRTLNHMEQNVYNGLHDSPTIHELSVLALYSQSISHPYMREVRGGEQPNLLDLGPLHARVSKHCEAIIADPDLLIGAGATYTTGAMDGLVWQRPEVIYVILKQASSLPYLRPLLVAFFEGALETWRRFTAEYAPGGIIDGTSQAERQAAYMKATNDENEGALGSYRVTQRRNPSMTIQTYNARKRFKLNKTGEYMKTMPATGRRAIRSMARRADSNRNERKRREVQAKYDQKVVEVKHAKDQVKQGKKDARAKLLEAITPVLDTAQLTSDKFTVPELDLQLEWHRQWDKEKDIPIKSKLANKAAKLAALKDAVARFNASGQAFGTCERVEEGPGMESGCRHESGGEESDDEVLLYH
ncbi:hypothetical protein FPV67DRAFT_1417864 [Lyophyllum atratum]|nr:hypothetical protein FPV67DRAFT_1417864 [Lyophyllum atratum]